MKFWILEKTDKKLPFIHYKGRIYLFIYPTKLLTEEAIRQLIPNEKDILIFEKELKLEKVPPLQLGKMEVIVTILVQIMTDPLRVQFCDLDKYEKYLSEQPN